MTTPAVRTCKSTSEQTCVEYEGSDTVTAPRNLEELIVKLHEVFESDHVEINHVKQLMESYQSKQSEWKKYAKFDPHRYTRNLVDEGNGKFNLMLLCWNENQGSSIHSHANSHCFLKVIDGTLKEELFDWPAESEPEAPMKTRRTLGFEKNQVTYINDDLGLHRVENPSHSDKAVSLHLYSPPFDECESFDERTGHQRTVQITFYSKFGKRTPFGQQNSTTCQASAENN